MVSETSNTKPGARSFWLGWCAAVVLTLTTISPGVAYGVEPAAPASAPADNSGTSDLAAITAKMGDGTEGQTKYKYPRHRKPGDPSPKLRRASCMTDASQCKCAEKDVAKIEICQPMIGYFCPESTINLMASKCVSLFGGITACRCATQQELQQYVVSEEKKSKKKKKKKRTKKK